MATKGSLVDRRKVYSEDDGVVAGWTNVSGGASYVYRLEWPELDVPVRSMWRR